MACTASLSMGSYRRNQRPGQEAWCVSGQFLGQWESVDIIIIPAAVSVVFLWTEYCRSKVRYESRVEAIISPASCSQSPRGLRLRLRQSG